MKSISYESFDLALSLFADSRQLPHATQERIGIEEEEVKYFYSLARRARDYADEVGNVSRVLVCITKASAADILTRREEIWETTSEHKEEPAAATLGVQIPASLAPKIYDLLYSTVIYHRWPELWYTTGAYPDEISRAFLEIFGKEEPTFLEL
ncbi:MULTISPECIES: hypothetical protein [unclassified Rathayibacter]|jgi:hypothetical protein|uniref:hypothetical protein n=1 Tax=unclassified Rathayibacter TaxID=2609250 RepID=UPI00141510B3|nr:MULTISPECIES: hypothetical protein [unclassified Rathayibacter]